MPTLRSQTAASASGNAKKNSDICEQGDATMEMAISLSNPSSPCLGPGTPLQDHEAARAGQNHEAARAGLLKRRPMVRRSRRLNVEVSLATADATPVENTSRLPHRKTNSGRGRFGEGVSLAVDEIIEGKRKAKDSLEETFRESSFEITPASRAKLNGSLLGSFRSPAVVEDATKPISAFLGEACDREGLASSTKGKGRGRRRGGSRGPDSMLRGAFPDHQTKEPLPFDLNQCLLVQSSSDELRDEAPSAERSLAAETVSVHLDTAEDCNITLLAEEPKEETVGAIEHSDDYALDAVPQQEAGPSHVPHTEVARQRRRARGRGRRGGAEASRSRFLQIARERAFHFAHFNADGDEAPAGAPPSHAVTFRRRGRQPRQIQQNRSQPTAQQADWPGPFSTARQLVNDRAEAAAARQRAVPSGSKVSFVDWHPTRVPGDPAFCRRKSPSLQDLCLSILSNNAESVSSLEGVPELFRLRVSNAFCERRKMSPKVFSLFFQGEPSEIHSLDCTQISENELTEMLKQIAPSRLEKLHLDNCGRALSERCLLATIASPSTVTLLKFVSLRGAYRLSDKGLEALLRASPQLVHLDLSTCSFLTNASVNAVACYGSETLESLVLDGCRNLNASVFVHDLVRLQKLQKISLAELTGVTDEVVSELCVQLGSHLRELVLACCYDLTDAATAAIGACCPYLQVLHLGNLSLLTDLAIAHITDNLREVHVLNLRRCKFSDEAIAAFVTASGGALRNLTLNSVHQVADQTVVALAKHSHMCLEFLDLSFCRLVEDECLGFLADACLQLQELKLYGCTQVTNKFMCGHNNPNLKVVGLRIPERFEVQPAAHKS